jgi:hypothetical protein
VSVSEILSSLGVPEGTASDGTASDGTVQTRINLHNETQLKDLLDIGLSPEQRSQHAGALLDGITVPGGQPGVPLLHRLIRHVIGNDELSDEDRAQLAPALPITAHVITQTPVGPPPKGAGGAKPAPMQVDYVWDVSTPDGSLKVIDLPNGIELLPGGCIVARSTPLHFSCTSLLREGSPPAGYGDFNILGATGAPVPTPPTPPPAAQAAAGAPGQCSSAGIAGEGGGPGSPGLQQGTAGAAGRVGSNGIASAIATISIRNSLAFRVAPKQQLVVATQPGPGGQGGDGGQGGPGQHGGNGGNGATCDCTGNNGGGAGAGGMGGTGGRAGDGGNGTAAAGNIAVLLPRGTSTSVVHAVSTPAPPGQPGNPGPGGPGGAAGQPGAAGKHSTAGATAGPGPAGDPGAPGNAGTHTGAAAQVTVTSL